MKHVVAYQKTKPVYDAYRKAKNKERYRAEHERDIILHKAAARALKTAGISKLPNPATLQKEYVACFITPLLHTCYAIETRF